MRELICITGTDGAGKSTLIESLAAQFSSVKVANIWDALEDGASAQLFKSKKDIDTYLCSLSPDSRLLFLAHALKFSVDKALSSDKEFIFLNAYYYKYFATELTLGANEQLTLSLIKNFPIADKVIQLTIDISEAANRKKQFSRYECGLTASPDRESFLKFQESALNNWKIFDKNNWTILDGNQTPGEIFKQAVEAIKK